MPTSLNARPDLKARFAAIVQRAMGGPVIPDTQQPFRYPYARELVPSVERLAKYSDWLYEMDIIGDRPNDPEQDVIMDIASIADSLAISGMTTYRFLLNEFPDEAMESRPYKNPNP